MEELVCLKRRFDGVVHQVAYYSLRIQACEFLQKFVDVFTSSLEDSGNRRSRHWMRPEHLEDSGPRNFRSRRRMRPEHLEDSVSKKASIPLEGLGKRTVSTPEGLIADRCSSSMWRTRADNILDPICRMDCFHGPVIIGFEIFGGPLLC